MMIQRMAVVAMVLVTTLTARAADQKAKDVSAADVLKLYEAREYKDGEGKALLYRLFKPADYDSAKKYPLVLFLHGAGGGGSDNRGQIMDANANNACRWAVEEIQKQYACFIVAPQCPPDRKWVEVDWSAMSHVQPEKPGEQLRLTMETLAVLRKEFSIDGDRIYVTGLSMGGYGTWDLLQRYPEYFAAGVPVCGGGDETKAERIAKIPIWVFHGEKDGVVKPQRSGNMVEAIKKAGGNAKYTEYPGVGHDSWVKAYREAELLPWLFGQKRGAK